MDDTRYSNGMAYMLFVLVVDDEKRICSSRKMRACAKDALATMRNTNGVDGNCQK